MSDVKDPREAVIHAARKWRSDPGGIAEFRLRQALAALDAAPIDDKSARAERYRYALAQIASRSDCEYARRVADEALYVAGKAEGEGK